MNGRKVIQLYLYNEDSIRVLASPARSLGGIAMLRRWKK